MLHEDQARKVLERALRTVKAPEIEARLAGGIISQVTMRDGDLVDQRRVSAHQLRVRAASDRSGSWRCTEASTTDLGRDAIEGLAKQIKIGLEAADEAPDYIPLPSPRELPEVPVVRGYDERIAESGTAFVLHTLADALLEGRRAGIVQDGRYVTTVGGITVDGTLTPYALANSAGLFAHHAGTAAQLVLRGGLERWPGWSELRMAESHRRATIDSAALGGELRASLAATEKAAPSGGPSALEAFGEESALILDRAAVAVLLSGLLPAFTASRVDAGRSPLAGQLGAHLFGSGLTLRSDVEHAALQARPFDVEGVPSVPLDLTREGVVRSLVYSRRSAARAGVAPTGHAFKSGEAHESLAAPVMEGGEGEVEALLDGVSTGVLVRSLVLESIDGRLARVYAPYGGVALRDGAVFGAVAPWRAEVDLFAVFGAFDAAGEPGRALGAVVPPLRVKAAGSVWNVECSV